MRTRAQCLRLEADNARWKKNYSFLFDVYELVKHMLETQKEETAYWKQRALAAELRIPPEGAQSIPSCWREGEREWKQGEVTCTVLRKEDK